MDKLTLTEAQQIIESIHRVLGVDSSLNMIEYEDGSGMRFNYKLARDTYPRFINLRPYYDKLQVVKEKRMLVDNLEMWLYESFNETISVRGKEAVNERISQILNKI